MFENSFASTIIEGNSFFIVNWSIFKNRFITSDGRVIDTGNGGISHSEGQGYGMLFAVHAGDRPLFERLWHWTQSNLGQDTCALHSWKYVPDAAIKVPENTAATDAELMLGLALTRAADRWNEPTFQQAARNIFADIRLLLTFQTNNMNLLLPGQNGFVHGDHIVVNPSYYLFPAIQAAKTVDDRAQWERLFSDGVALLARTRFGQWQLPADWIAVQNKDGNLQPADGWPPRFSYDAIRVPLYARWGNVLDQIGSKRFTDYWRHFAPHIPAWVDLHTGERSSYDASTGFRNVALLSGLQDDALPALSSLGNFSETDDYYSSALCLLSFMITKELRSATPAPTGTL